MALEQPDVSQEISTRTWLRRPLLGALIGQVAGLQVLRDSAARKKKKKKVKLCLDGRPISVPKKKKSSYVKQGAIVGACPPACIPACNGKPCGVADGCGSVCGCPSGQLCHEGICKTCSITCSGAAAECGTALQDKIDLGGNVFVCPGRYAHNFVVGTQNVKLIGAGQGADPSTSTILDGNQTGRVMLVETNFSVELENLHVTGGLNSSSAAIRNEGTLTVRGCTIAGNTATGSTGGIEQNGVATGPVSLTECTISANTSTARAGGLSQFNATHPLTLTNCTVTGNETDGEGGGIWVSGGTVNVSGGSITNNRAAVGGGIFNGSGTVNVTGTNVSGNDPNQCTNVSSC